MANLVILNAPESVERLATIDVLREALQTAEDEESVHATALVLVTGDRRTFLKWNGHLHDLLGAVTLLRRAIEDDMFE